jgi:hypothetical protein
MPITSMIMEMMHLIKAEYGGAVDNGTFLQVLRKGHRHAHRQVR